MSDNYIVTNQDAVESMEQRYNYEGEVSYDERTMRDMERRYPTAEALERSIEASRKSIELYTAEAAEIAAVEAELRKNFEEAEAAAKEAQRKALTARAEFSRIKNQRERAEKAINTSKREIDKLENELERVKAGLDPVYIRGQGLVRGAGKSRVISLQESQREVREQLDRSCS